MGVGTWAKPSSAWIPSVADDTSDSDAGDDDRFQLAAQAARRVVKRCRAHASMTTKSLQGYTDKAAPSTLYAKDIANAVAHNHRIAFEQTVNQVEVLSNAIVSHLEGLNLLMRDDTFHALPATVIVRSIVEAAASCSWILEPEVSADERVARAYAVVFHSVEDSIAQLTPKTDLDPAKMREKLVESLSASGVSVQRRTRGDRTFDEVAQVVVGKVRVRTRYNISQRIAEQIPSIGTMYGGLSAVAHGEQFHVLNAWERPDAFARRIGFVVHEAVAAWSRAVHDWVGAEPGLVDNAEDLERIKQSIAPDVVADIKGRGRGHEGTR